jgi:hypothetical protein
MGGAESHGVEGQHTLEALEQIEDQKAEDAEGEQASGVLGPALVDSFLDAAKDVAEAFERPENGMKKRPVARENFRHVRAHRLGEGENQDEEGGNLQSSVGCHIDINRILESLRFEERENQVQEEKKRGNSG